MKQEKLITDRGRSFNNLRSYLSKPENLLSLFFFLVLCILIIYPLYAVLASSVTVGVKDSMMYNSLFGEHLKKGEFSFNNFSMLIGGKYTKEYSVAFFWKPLLNSFLMSVFASIISLVLGGSCFHT